MRQRRAGIGAAAGALALGQRQQALVRRPQVGGQGLAQVQLGQPQQAVLAVGMVRRQAGARGGGGLQQRAGGGGLAGAQQRAAQVVAGARLGQRRRAQLLAQPQRAPVGGQRLGGVAVLDQRMGQVVDAERQAQRLAQQGLVQRGRAAQLAHRIARAAAVQQRQAVLVQRVGRLAAVGAVHPLGQRQHPLQDGQRFVQALQRQQRGAQVGQRAQCGRVVVAQQPRLQRQRLAVVGQRGLEAVGSVFQEAQVVQAAGDVLAVRVACTPRGQGLLLQPARLVEAAQVAQHHAQVVARGGQLGAVGRALLRLQRESTPRGRLGLGFAAQVGAQHGQPAQRQRLQVGPLLLGREAGGGGVEGVRGLRAAQVLVGQAQHALQLGLQRRLAGEVALQALAAAVQQRRGRQVGAARLVGVGILEQRAEEAAGLPRRRGLGRRALLGGQRAIAALCQLPGEAGGHRQRRRACQHPGPLAPQGLGQHIAAPPWQGLHRPVRLPAPQVVDQGLRRGVALGGVRRAGARDDGLPFARPRRAGQQFLGQATEAVDIGGAAQRRAGLLLGAGVARRQARGGAVAIDLLQPRDAEVQQHRMALGGDQHVGGLEVAVHDQVAVREVQRRADLAQQLQPLRQRRAGGPGVQRASVDEGHDEVGPARGRGAAVQQPRDVRVLQRRQDLALAGQQLGRRLAAQQLDGGALLVEAVGALGREHAAHAALAQLAGQPPGPQAVAGLQLAGGELPQRGGHRGGEARRRAAPLAFAHGQHALALRGRGAQRLQPGALLRGVRQVGDRQEQVFDRAHASSGRSSFSASQARAKRRSRSTVGTERSSTRAMSSRCRPAK